MKYNCALQLEGCFGTTIGFRGMCSNCYKELVEEGIITKGDSFRDFPDWLKEMIRFEDAQYHIDVRHPFESYDDYEELLVQNEKISATRVPLGVEGCYRQRRHLNLDAQIMSSV